MAIRLFWSRSWDTFPLQLEHPEEILALLSSGETIFSNRFFGRLPLLVLTQTAICFTEGGILYEEPQLVAVVFTA